MNANLTIVANIDVVINLNNSFTGEQEQIMEHASKACPE
jgi:hypothetical protein